MKTTLIEAMENMNGKDVLRAFNLNAAAELGRDIDDHEQFEEVQQTDFFNHLAGIKEKFATSGWKNENIGMVADFMYLVQNLTFRGSMDHEPIVTETKGLKDKLELLKIMIERFEMMI